MQRTREHRSTARSPSCRTPVPIGKRYSPRDLPDAKILYALARHVLAGREHTYRQETNGSAGVPVGRIRFVLEVDSVEFWGTTWSEVAADKWWS